MLLDRRDERAALDGLVQRIRAGQSSVLVLRGEAGIGKTALLDHVAEQADGCRVARVAGVQGETELAFAGLHQLCAPPSRSPNATHSECCWGTGRASIPPSSGAHS